MKDLLNELLDMSRFSMDTTSRASQRGEMLDRFLGPLNFSRMKSGYKSLDHSRLTMLLFHVDTANLHAFYKKCDGGNNFSKLLVWHVKPK